MKSYGCGCNHSTIEPTVNGDGGDCDVLLPPKLVCGPTGPAKASENGRQDPESGDLTHNVDQDSEPLTIPTLY
jgi:hypothetical protein